MGELLKLAGVGERREESEVEFERGRGRPGWVSGGGASRRILVGQILMGRCFLGVYLNDDVGSVDDLGGGGRRTRADEDGGHVELNDSNEWWSSGRKRRARQRATLSWLAPHARTLAGPASQPIPKRPALAPSPAPPPARLIVLRLPTRSEARRRRPSHVSPPSGGASRWESASPLESSSSWWMAHSGVPFHCSERGRNKKGMIIRASLFSLGSLSGTCASEQAGPARPPPSLPLPPGERTRPPHDRHRARGASQRPGVVFFFDGSKYESPRGGEKRSGIAPWQSPQRICPIRWWSP